MLLSLRYRLLRSLLRMLVRCGVDEPDLEAAVLRHQLRILGRGGVRPRFTTTDRAFLAAAAQLLSRDRWRSFLVRPDTLLRWHRELLRGRRGRRSRPPRTSSARSLDREPDPSIGPGEPEVGLPQDPRGAPEARHRRLGHDDRHGASPRRPRPGTAAQRADLETVPQVAGERPALSRVSIRRAGGRRRPRTGSGPGCKGPASDDSATAYDMDVI